MVWTSKSFQPIDTAVNLPYRQFEENCSLKGGQFFLKLSVSPELQYTNYNIDIMKNIGSDER